MLVWFLRWLVRSPGRKRRRIGRAGCLLWVLGLIIVVLVLSLLFGGFQKGTKAGADGAPAPRPVAASW